MSTLYESELLHPVMDVFAIVGSQQQIDVVASQIRGICEAAGVIIESVEPTPAAAETVERRRKPNDGYKWLREDEFKDYLTCDGYYPEDARIATRGFGLLCEYEREFRGRNPSAPVRSFITPRKNDVNRQVRIDIVIEALEREIDVKGFGKKISKHFAEYIGFEPYTI